jgi:hypothetical protein
MEPAARAISPMAIALARAAGSYSASIGICARLPGPAPVFKEILNE